MSHLLVLSRAARRASDTINTSKMHGVNGGFGEFQ